MDRRRLWNERAALLLAAIAMACATVRTPESGFAAQLPSQRMSTAELRVHVRDLASRFSGLLESLADAGIARSNDLDTRLRLTAFKFNAIPAMQAALFQPDPVAALVDAWALLTQIEHALAAGRARGPEETALARERLGEMEAELEALWGRLAGEKSVARTRARLEAWAKDHPLPETIASRHSTASLLAELTADQKLSLTGTAGALLDTAEDLAARADLQTAFLPKNARWQAEFLLFGLLHQAGFAGLSSDAACVVGKAEAPPVQADLGELVKALERASSSAASFPSVLARERGAVLSSLRTERLDTQSFVQQERAVVLEQTDTMVREWVDLGAHRATALVDRVFRWLLLLLGLAGLVALSAVLLWHQLARRRGRTVTVLRERPV